MELLTKATHAVEDALPVRVEKKVGKVQDFAPLDYIGKDTVRLTDGSCFAILRVHPTNAFLLSEEEFTRNTNTYEEHIRQVRYPFQILVQAHVVDMDANLVKLRESQKKARFNHPNEAQLADLGENELTTLRQEHAKNPMMDYAYYVLVPADLEHTEDNDQERIFSFPYTENNLPSGVSGSLDVRVAEWIELESAGLHIERMKTGELLDLYYRMFNDDLAKRQPMPADLDRQLHNVASQIQINRGRLGKERRKDKSTPEKNGEVKDLKPVSLEQLLFGPGSRTLLDISAPASIDSEDNVVTLGDTSIRVLRVINEFGKGLPDKPVDGWLKGAFGKRRDFLFSFHISPYEKDDAKALLNAQLQDFRAQDYRNVVQLNDPDSDLNKTIKDHEKLQEQVTDGDKTVVNLDWYIGVPAPKTPGQKALKDNQNEIEGMLGGMGVHTREINDRHIEASLALLPFNRNRNRQGRDVDSGYVAGMMPFLTDNILDVHGVPIGYNVDTMTQIWLDLHADRLPNRNTVIFGAFGMGKSYFAKQLAYLNYLYYGQPFVAIDQGNTTEWYRLMRFLNEQYIYFGPSSTARINPCELYLPSSFAGDRERNPLGRKKQELFLFVQALYRSIGHNLLPDDHTPLNQAIDAMYENAGITENRRTHSKRPPLLKNLQEELLHSDDPNNIRRHRAAILGGYLDKFTTGNYAKMFYDQSTVRLKGSVAFNLSEMSEEDRIWGTYLINRFTFDQAQDELVPRNLFIDEGWKLMKTKELAENVNQSTRESRRSDIAQVFITQEPTDAIGPGEIIVKTAANVVLLGQEEAAMDDISGIFKLTSEERKRIRTNEPGRGLLISGGRKAALKTRINPWIHSLITTKAAEVAYINKVEEELKLHPQLDTTQRPIFALGGGIRVL